MGMTHEEMLEYYAAPGVFTDLAEFGEQVDAVPGDIASMVRVVQGLVLNYGWAPAYGVTVPPERAATEKEIRSAAGMIECAMGHDARAITEARAPEHRVAGVCWHFAVLFAAIARHKGIPARVRAGFSNYFDRSKHTEHWVGEYWSREEHRWVLVDAQVDALQARIVGLDFETLDVPRDRFLVAGDAWRACRAGADASTFGVAGTANWGLIETFGEVMQDLAALQKIELLPWGWYGIAIEDGAVERDAPLMDRLAAISSAADAGAVEELREMVVADARLRVPEERPGATT